jgi:phosphate transport system protein
MVRETFNAQLKDLQQQIIRMGSLVEETIAGSVSALKAQDAALAQKVIDEDDKVDDYYGQIEDQCLRLIATQQPMAKDCGELLPG